MTIDATEPTVTLAQLEETVSLILENIHAITREAPASVDVQNAIAELVPVAPSLARALNLVLLRRLERLAQWGAD